MARLTKDTWVVIADGEKALFLRNITDAADPNLEVIRKKMQDNPPTRNQGTDAPGRGHDGGPGHRSAFDDTDWHQLAKGRFARELAELLYRRAHAGSFERLVLVAAPQVLGELRLALHKEVAQRVIAEIPKTLTNHALDDVETILKDALASA